MNLGAEETQVPPGKSHSLKRWTLFRLRLTIVDQRCPVHTWDWTLSTTRLGASKILFLYCLRPWLGSCPDLSLFLQIIWLIWAGNHICLSGSPRRFKCPLYNRLPACWSKAAAPVSWACPLTKPSSAAPSFPDDPVQKPFLYISSYLVVKTAYSSTFTLTQ